MVRRLAAWVVIALACACTSPTLPLPPPIAPSIATGTEPNTWRLHSESGAEPNALIIVVNRDESLPRSDRVAGTIADQNGSWDLVVKGAVNDVVDVSQESGSTRSATTTITLK